MLNKWYNQTVLMLGIVVVNSLATPRCNALDYFWSNLEGGLYHTASNWAGGGVPGAEDDLQFPFPAVYNVQLFEDATATGLVVDNSQPTLQALASSEVDPTLSLKWIDVKQGGVVTIARGFGSRDVNLNVKSRSRLRDGQLWIRDGATVSFGETLELGDHEGGHGVLQVTGGETSQPELTANRFRLDNGEIYASGGAALTGSTTIGSSSGPGRITLVGNDNGNARTQWSSTLMDLERGELNVVSGASLIGSLKVQAIDGHVAAFRVAGSNVEGRHSTVNLGNLRVGTDGTLGGDASMSIEEGGHVAALDGKIGDARVTVRGSDQFGNRSTWEPVALKIDNGAKLDIEDGGIVRGETAVLSTFGESTVNVAGTDGMGNPSTWIVNQEMRVGSGTGSSLRVMGGARLETNTTQIGSLTDGVARVTVQSNSGEPTSTWMNSGDALLLGGREDLPAELLVFSGGAVEIGGELRIDENSRVVVRDGRLSADIIDPSEGGVFGFESGRLEIGNYVGDLSNPSGILEPGPNVAATTIRGDYTQGADANLLMEIGGLSAGGSHDVVNIIGDAIIDGDLELSLIDDFRPEPSDTFTLLGAHDLIGVFDNINTGQRLETTDGSGSFVVNYGLGSAFDQDQIVLSDFEWLAGLAGDFNHDGLLDALDIDLLSAAVGGTDLSFDLNGNGRVDAADRRFWVEDLKGTYFGDADMSQSVEFADFLALANGFGGPGRWSEGDFDGSGDVVFADFLLLTSNFGNSLVETIASTVPEPAGEVSAILSLVGLFWFRRVSGSWDERCGKLTCTDSRSEYVAELEF